jgi:ZIP family zinc transporter
MLAASFFSLILPGLELAEADTGSATLATAIVVVGLLAGAIAIWVVHEYVPHEHFLTGREGAGGERIERIWLFVLAIALHNLPEGMAVGVGFAGGNLGNGLALAIGIFLQNIPEGLAVAAALASIGYGTGASYWIAAFTGLLEPLGGLVGAGAVWAAEPLMPWILGFAAGAMLFVIGNEIIPETHRRGHAHAATFALLGGLVLMMALDAFLA